VPWSGDNFNLENSVLNQLVFVKPFFLLQKKSFNIIYDVWVTARENRCDETIKICRKKHIAWHQYDQQARKENRLQLGNQQLS